MALTRPNQTQLSTNVAKFVDPLIPFNTGETGTNAKDIGIVFERGSLDNVALIWDESADQFAIINTTETGTTNGNVVISSYASLRVGNFTTNGITYPSTDGTAGQFIQTDGAGTLSFQDIDLATTTTVGVASFSSDNFSVSVSGAVTIVDLDGGTF